MATDKILDGNRISTADPLPVSTAPSLAATGTPAKVSVSTSSTAIVAADATRRLPVLVQVLSGGPVFVSTGTATANDFPLPTGSVYKHASTAALAGIVASATADVRTWTEA